MNRREFSKRMLMLGIGTYAGTAKGSPAEAEIGPGNFYEEPAKKLPVTLFAFFPADFSIFSTLSLTKFIFAFKVSFLQQCLPDINAIANKCKNIFRKYEKI